VALDAHSSKPSSRERSGTTLLSRLLREPALADTAVVFNELGEVGLDHVLVDRGSEDDVVLLDSGCLCCALGNSLQETLESLHYRRERNELPPFSRVIVETTGVADPGPIIATLDLDAAIARHYRPGSIVTVTRDGRRPLLVELQALVDRMRFGSPRRVAQGLDAQRIAMLLAVMNRHAGVSLQEHDVFVNLVGGLEVTETACDLPVALALASSLADKPIAQRMPSAMSDS